MAYHSKLFSPSGAHKWINCQGAYRLQELLEKTHKFPEKDWSIADEGTRAHHAAELLLADKPVDHISLQMIEHVQDYVSSIQMLPEAHLEIRVDFSSWIEQPDAMGTADCIIIQENVLEIRDFKYGYVKVDAYQNEQLMLYALGALQSLDLRYKFRRCEMDTIKFSIWQPRAYHHSFWQCSFPELMLFAAKAQRAAYRVTVANKMPTLENLLPFLEAGVKQCGYCDCAPFCPKVYEKLEDIKDACHEDD